MRHRVLLILGIFFLVSSTLQAKSIWTVAANGADFTTIQAAIDHADPGDVILVNPEATPYDYFVLEKGIMIKGLGHGPVNVRGFTIRNVPAGELAALSHFSFDAAETLEVADCRGEVMLDGLRHIYAFHGLTIRRSDSVSVNRCVFVPDDHSPYPFAGNALNVFTSTAKIHNCIIRGAQYKVIDPRGTPGLAIHASRVVLSMTSIQGGHAPDSPGQPFVVGAGGAGVEMRYASSLMVVGTASHSIDGGQGRMNPQGQGGPGGHAIDNVDQDSFVEISKVQLNGGRGGVGNPRGVDGLPFNGPPSHLNRVFHHPYLVTSGQLKPGGDLTLFVDSDFPGAEVYMLISQNGGWQDRPSWSGPPLATAPGGVYFGFFMAVADGSGNSIHHFLLPDNHAFQGWPLHAQAGVISSNGVFLTNSVERLIAGE